MPFMRNQTYVVIRDFATRDFDDELIAFKKGEEFTTGEDRLLTDPVTGEVIRLENHVRARPEWYFLRKGSFDRADAPSQEQYVLEIIKNESGLDLESYWETVQLEHCGPLKTPIKNASNMSACISLVKSNHAIEMRDPEGNLVESIGHNAKNCTFHFKKKVA